MLAALLTKTDCRPTLPPSQTGDQSCLSYSFPDCGGTQTPANRGAVSVADVMECPHDSAFGCRPDGLHRIHMRTVGTPLLLPVIDSLVPEDLSHLLIGAMLVHMQNGTFFHMVQNIQI